MDEFVHLDFLLEDPDTRALQVQCGIESFVKHCKTKEFKTVLSETLYLKIFGLDLNARDVYKYIPKNIQVVEFARCRWYEEKYDAYNFSSVPSNVESIVLTGRPEYYGTVDVQLEFPILFPKTVKNIYVYNNLISEQNQEIELVMPKKLNIFHVEGPLTLDILNGSQPNTLEIEQFMDFDKWINNWPKNIKKVELETTTKQQVAQLKKNNVEVEVLTSTPPRKL